jgi:hypothetical protein
MSVPSRSPVTERVPSAAKDQATLSNAEVWVLHLREREVIHLADRPVLVGR